MKAISIEAPGRIGLKEIPFPQRQEGMAIVKVKSMGICGSDVAAYRAASPNVSYPLIIGHETAGIVQEIDDGNAYGFGVGDRVILEPYIPCGECYPCSLGRTNCCTHLKVLGVQTDGSMCEYFAHPVKLLRHVPEGMPWELVPMIEPLSIALHSIHTVELRAGQHVVIVGAGAIGLLIAMTALAYGAVPILLDIADGRLEMAKSLGVVHTIHSAREDAVRAIADITEGRMAEAVIEASGAPQAVANTLHYAANTGKVALTGWPKTDITLTTALITRKELQLRGSRNSAGEFPEAAGLISSGRVAAEKIISEVVDFAALPDAVKRLDQSPDKFIKIIALFYDS